MALTKKNFRGSQWLQLVQPRSKCVRKVRLIRIFGDVAYVPLTQGYETVIDAADVPLIADWNWCAIKNRHVVYATRSERAGGRKVTVAMHRVIASAPIGMQIDHRDGDGLNNRRSNLRLATIAENSRNRRTQSNSLNGLKGVYWSKSQTRWRARIQFEGKRVYLGYFDTAKDAHVAYCDAAKRLHGEFARFS